MENTTTTNNNNENKSGQNGNNEIRSSEIPTTAIQKDHNYANPPMAPPTTSHVDHCCGASQPAECGGAHDEKAIAAVPEREAAADGEHSLLLLLTDHDPDTNNMKMHPNNGVHPAILQTSKTTRQLELNGGKNGCIERQQQQRGSNSQPFFGRFRLCIALLLALATYSYTSMRMNLSMAMVCMVNSTAIHIAERGGNGDDGAQLVALSNTSTDGQIAASLQSGLPSSAGEMELMIFGGGNECPAAGHLPASEVSKSMGYQGTLEWSTAQQARLFAATFYGSIFTVWVSGYLADRFGPKLLIALAIADYTLVSLLSPLFVSIHYNVFFAARFFMGFGEGLVMPALASTSARWFPPAERSLMAAVCTVGNQLAALIALLLSSRLCALEILGGWPSIFYAFGLMGVMCLALWLVFASNSPKQSSWIGAEEREMISASLMEQSSNPTNGQQREEQICNTKKPNHGRLPWRKMVVCMPLYAGILGQANYTFCNVIMQSYLPTFFKEVVQLNLKDNGFYSVIPFVTMLCSKIAFGIGADWMRRNQVITDTANVKLFQCISNFGSATAAVCMALLVSCKTPALAALFMALWGTSYGASTSGFFTANLSIAPRYSGTITSLSTAMGILCSGLAPLVVSAIVKQGTIGEWRAIWFLMAGCNLFCITFFLLFASAKQQRWALQYRSSMQRKNEQRN